MSSLLGRMRILLQYTCFPRLSITAEQHWCHGVDVYLCISALAQRDGEAGDSGQEGYRDFQRSKQSFWDLQGVNLLEPEGSPCP